MYVRRWRWRLDFRFQNHNCRTILLVSAGGDVRVNGYTNEEDEGKGVQQPGRMPRRQGHWIFADAFVRKGHVGTKTTREVVVECLATDRCKEPQRTS